MAENDSNITGTSNERRTLRTVLVVIGGILVHLTLGSIYTFGNLSPYMISYLRERTDDKDVKNVDSLWISIVGSACGAIGTSLGGIADRTLGPRLATGIGCLIYSGAVALTYFSIKRSLFLAAITYGLLGNFGTSFAYGPPAQTAVKWIPKRPSFAVGIILCGFGGGALVFNQVITAFVNPENLSPDLETSDGEKYFTDAHLLDKVPNVFLLLAAIYVPMQVIGILCITLPPNFTESVIETQKPTVDNQKKYINEELSIPDYGAVTIKKDIDESNNANATQVIRDTKKIPVRELLSQLLRNRNSYIVWLMVVCIHSGMQFAISLYKAYAQTFISDDQFLALVGSLSSIFNCICRPMWGMVMDKYGFETTVKLLSTGFVALTSTLLLTEMLPKEFFMIWICALYACFCGIWPVAPATFARLFGTNNMAINMGFIMLAASVASILGGVAGLSLKSLIGWHGLFLMSGFLGAIAFFITFFFNGRDMEGKKI